QHLLLIAGMFLLARFYQERRTIVLAGGCFLFGLAMWDKALAIWILSGIAVGGILTIPRQILAVITLRRAAISVLSFALGALPLIAFNVKHPLATFRQDVAYATLDIPAKARLLLATANR